MKTDEFFGYVVGRDFYPADSTLISEGEKQRAIKVVHAESRPTLSGEVTAEIYECLNSNEGCETYGCKKFGDCTDDKKCQSQMDLAKKLSSLLKPQEPGSANMSEFLMWAEENKWFPYKGKWRQNKGRGAGFKAERHEDLYEIFKQEKHGK